MAPYVQAYDRLGLAPSRSRQSSVSWMRLSAACDQYNCIQSNAPSQTALVPARIVLRATSTDSTNDDNPYLLISVSGRGFHSVADQWTGLDNTFFQYAATAQSPGQPDAGQPVQLPAAGAGPAAEHRQPHTGTPYTFPLRSVDLGGQSFNSLVQLSGGGAHYGYQVLTALAAQQSNGDGYGEVTFLQYEQAGYRSIRQVQLTPAGSSPSSTRCGSDGSSSAKAAAMAGGVIWRLWPQVTAQGGNWAVQSWQMQMNNTNAVPHSQQSVLV